MLPHFYNMLKLLSVSMIQFHNRFSAIHKASQSVHHQEFSQSNVNYCDHECLNPEIQPNKVK